MNAPQKWLHIVGIGDDGLNSLTPATRSLVETAEVLVGAERHHVLTQELAAERLSWPSPFSALVETLKDLQGRRVVVLATGDPLWYSVGASLAKQFDMSEMMFHPQVSAFQLASARMGWSLANTETLTVHGRAAEQLLPFLAPEQKHLLLTSDARTPVQVAELLAAHGYGASTLTVLAHMGGSGEAQFGGVARDWAHNCDEVFPDFHTLALECVAEAKANLLPRTALPDGAFVSDGTMTKRDIRAVTLAKLNPMRGALLWDIGCGAGTVAIEWMRAAKDARAVGIERREDRRAMAAQNALTLGAPQLRLIDADLPEGMDALDAPDAVFIGGGLSHEVFQTAWAALKPHGRLVINTVTLEGATILFDLHREYGGDLVQIGVSQAAPVGGLTAWRPSMPVTQLCLVKSGAVA